MNSLLRGALGRSSPPKFCSFEFRSDGKGRNRRAGFIFHFQYYIWHSPFSVQAAPAMTDGKRKMENGNYLEIFDDRLSTTLGYHTRRRRFSPERQFAGPGFG